MGLSAPDKPFAWQQALLADFLKAHIPAALDIPTGLGKTSVMAIWLTALASRAGAPRRLVYVVDRRAVVDQATKEALQLRAFVDQRADFRAKLGLAGSLPISTLRGQYVDNREWLGNPASPAIIIGTVDMIGSRLLFEGFGVSRKMRPYHAGLLGADTLVVLDEAHLVPPFEKLLEAVAKAESNLQPKGVDVRALVPTTLRAPTSAAPLKQDRLPRYVRDQSPSFANDHYRPASLEPRMWTTCSHPCAP